MTPAYLLHLLTCWRYQLQQSRAMRDLDFHRQRVRECDADLRRAKAAEVGEKMAWEQYRRVLR